jgi:probable HAF family extracellular repeat protein
MSPKFHKSAPVAAALLVLTVLLSTAAGAQANYSIRRLHPLGASFTDTRGGINSRGQVAGTLIRQGSLFAYRWTNGSFRVLGPGAANAINSHGDVVGVSAVTNHATLWKHGHTFDLGTLGEGHSSVALGINQNRIVVGYDQENPSGNTHPFQWEASTGMVQLQDFGGLHAQATGINSLNTIVGWSDDPLPSTIRHAVTWQNGALTQFFVPQTAPTTTKINDSDEVLVQNVTPTITQGIETQIDKWGFSINILYPMLNVVATDINNPGTVVGYDFDSQGSTRPFVCLASRQVFDLNALIPPAAQQRWVLQVAQGINDRGQIVGYGKFDGVQSAFILTPTGPVQHPSCY